MLGQYDNRRGTVQRSVSIFIALSLALVAQVASGQGTFGSMFQSSSILPIESAFQINRVSRDQIEIRIADGVYLYDNQTRVETTDGSEIFASRPDAVMYDDPIFGPTPIHRGQIQLTLATSDETVILHYQGCADIGFCYPPAQTELSFSR